MESRCSNLEKVLRDEAPTVFPKSLPFIMCRCNVVNKGCALYCPSPHPQRCSWKNHGEQCHRGNPPNIALCIILLRSIWATKTALNSSLVTFLHQCPSCILRDVVSYQNQRCMMSATELTKGPSHFLPNRSQGDNIAITTPIIDEYLAITVSNVSNLKRVCKTHFRNWRPMKIAYLPFWYFRGFTSFPFALRKIERRYHWHIISFYFWCWAKSSWSFQRLNQSVSASTHETKRKFRHVLHLPRSVRSTWCRLRRGYQVRITEFL
jgi:hypothetical protein